MAPITRQLDPDEQIRFLSKRFDESPGTVFASVVDKPDVAVARDFPARDQIFHEPRQLRGRVLSGIRFQSTGL